MNPLMEKMLAAKPADNTGVLTEFLGVFTGAVVETQIKPFLLSERSKWTALRCNTPIVYCGKFVPKGDGIVVGVYSHSVPIILFSLLEKSEEKILTTDLLDKMFRDSNDAIIYGNLDSMDVRNAYAGDFFKVGYFISSAHGRALFNSNLRKLTSVDRLFIHSIGGEELDLGFDFD